MDSEEEYVPVGEPIFSEKPELIPRGRGRGRGRGPGRPPKNQIGRITKTPMFKNSK